MITKDDFIEELKKDYMSDDELVDRYILYGTPYIFEREEQKYFELKKEICSNFEIESKKNIIVVGSSKLGFSLAPNKRFREIQDDSDVDVAIIDEYLFDNYWKKLYEYNVSLRSRNENEEKRYRKFLEYLFKGWLRPDLFPFRYKGQQDWFDFFKSISYKNYDKRKVAGAIYRNEYFFKKYHEENIKSLREEIKLYGEV